MSRVRIAVVGAGLIGRRHIDLVRRHPGCELVSVVDSDPAARERSGVPGYAELPDMLTSARPDAVVVASPNRCHAEHVLCCVEAGIPVLVEKPLADTVAAGAAMVATAEAEGVPLLVGHHRRHSPILAAAQDIVCRGELGRLVAVQGCALFYKPDDYFESGSWRSEPGGGPILINLIHDIDSLRALCGDVVSVQAITSSAVRRFAVEDTAALTLRFDSGVLGTFLLSDTAASSRSWEQTSREDAGYPSYAGEDCYLLAGTHGSLAIPTMRLQVFRGKRSWREPFRTTVVPAPEHDPLARQLDHFCAVVGGEARPLVDGREGLRTLRAARAVVEAARTGGLVTVG
ncbi:oxidoreductase [Prauserella marina]|uniref:Gfo/Idh/MocA family protein n=1 Tax=Prauserella marina TaxID=530584 RepID=UPI000B84669A|nr:Gfo/Idh/MocA family oxidoreductase [Prauserella marina]ASR39430.1 oxidoreductase [Prauserella marina]